MVRFSHIAWALLAAACALAFVYTGAGVLFGLTVATLAVPFVGLAFVWPAMRRVSATLTTPTVAQKGVGVPCTLHVSNASRMPLARVEATVEVRNLLTSQTELTRIRASVPARGEGEVGCTLASALCGRVEARVVRLSGYEPFGLLRRSIACDAVRRLSVMPNLYEAQLDTSVSISPDSDTTVYSQYVRGQDLSETFGIRDYQPGDELRRIHWKLSDKVGHTVVREASLPLDNRIMVFWDKSLIGGVAGRPGRPGGAQTPGATPEAADTMAEVVLGLCEQLSHDGIEYDVAYNDVEAERVHVRHVSDEDGIYEAIGEVMGHPLAPSGEGGLTTYARELGDPVSTRILYVGASEPFEGQDLARTRRFLAFVCDGRSGIAAGPQYSVVHMAPGEAELALAQAGVM